MTNGLKLMLLLFFITSPSKEKDNLNPDAKSHQD
jgi:hypothetical protein